MNICRLHEYVLIKIFSYCTNKDLENLYYVCEWFRWIIEEKIYARRTRSLLLCGHNSNLQRNFDRLTHRERLRISANWMNGRYVEGSHFPNRRFFASKIILDDKYIYKSHGEYIRVHKRTKIDTLERRYTKEIGTSIKTDITDFKKKGKTIFGGRANGYGLLYEDENIMEQRLFDVKQYITSVDFRDDLFVTSSDKTCKLWSKSEEFGLSNFELVKDYKIPFKVVCISESGQIFGGKYFNTGHETLYELDIETGEMKILNSDTFSIYDIKLKDENVIFTGNFDSTVRIFDRRTNCDECIWMDPFDSSIYCLEYDGLYSLLCGMKYHCRVSLYDIRNPKDHVQMYFPKLLKAYGSPVYSIACDCRYLFIATDRNVRSLDFKADYAPSKDYRNLFVNRILINA